jgi:threonine/homoserine/homoserine lactone efflux protein
MVAARARALLLRPLFARWVNRVVGVVFISFAAALLTLRRQVA